MSHTPGSWTFDTSTGHIIAGDEQGWEVVGQALNPANGVMMAAAPDLLELLNQLASMPLTAKAKDFDRLVGAARAAITKAVGRET